MMEAADENGTSRLPLCRLRFEPHILNKAIPHQIDSPRRHGKSKSLVVGGVKLQEHLNLPGMCIILPDLICAAGGMIQERYSGLSIEVASKRGLSLGVNSDSPQHRLDCVA